MNDSRPVAYLKHTSWYMSDHYICLQYLLFLSLIFRLCWLWPNRELVWDIIRGKFAKQLLSGCSLIRIVSSTTPGSVSLVHGFTHDKSVPGLFSTCLDFFFGGRSGIVIGAFRSIFLLTILMLIKAVVCFWQSKHTISFIYTIPNCTEEQQYIILLYSAILWNFSFHWQLSILVEKFHFCSRIYFKSENFQGGLEPPLPLPLLRAWIALL